MRWPVLACLAAAALLLAAGPAKAEVAGPPPVDVRVDAAPALAPDGLAATVALQPKDGPGTYSVQVGLAPARVEASWTASGVAQQAWILDAEVRSNQTWVYEAVAEPPALAWAQPQSFVVRTDMAHPVAAARPVEAPAAALQQSGSWRFQVMHEAGSALPAEASTASSGVPPLILRQASPDSRALAHAGIAGPGHVATAVAFLEYDLSPATHGMQEPPVRANPAHLPAPGPLVEHAVGQGPSVGTRHVNGPASPALASPDVLHAVVWSSPTTVTVDAERGLRIFVPSGDLEALGLREPEATPGVPAPHEAGQGVEEGPDTRSSGGAAGGPSPPTQAAPLVFLRIVSAEHTEPLVVHVGSEGRAAQVPLALPAQESGADGGTLALACATVAAAGLGLLAWLRCRGIELPLPPALLLLFTRLRRPELLENETRRRIHEAIEAEPGIQYAPLRRRLGLPAGVLTHHLSVLEAHGLVASLRHGARRHLYAGPRPGPAPAGDPRERILGLVDGRPLAQRDIAAAMTASRQAVGYHLQALLAAGRIQRQRDRDGRWLYHPAATPQAE